MKIFDKLMKASFKHDAANGLACSGQFTQDGNGQLVGVSSGAVMRKGESLGSFSMDNDRPNIVAYNIDDTMAVTAAAVECIQLLKEAK